MERLWLQREWAPNPSPALMISVNFGNLISLGPVSFIYKMQIIFTLRGWKRLRDNVHEKCGTLPSLGGQWYRTDSERWVGEFFLLLGATSDGSEKGRRLVANRTEILGQSLISLSYIIQTNASPGMVWPELGAHSTLVTIELLPHLRAREHVWNQSQFNFKWSTLTAPDWKPLPSFSNSHAKRERETHILIFL